MLKTRANWEEAIQAIQQGTHPMCQQTQALALQLPLKDNAAPGSCSLQPVGDPSQDHPCIPMSDDWQGSAPALENAIEPQVAELDPDDGLQTDIDDGVSGD